MTWRRVDGASELLKLFTILPQATKGFPLLMPHLRFKILCPLDISVPPSVDFQTLRNLYLYVGDSFLPYHFSPDIWNWILQRYYLPLTDKKCLFLARWIFCLALLPSPFICPLLHCSCCSLSSCMSSFSPPPPFLVYSFSTFCSILHVYLQSPFTDTTSAHPTCLNSSAWSWCSGYIDWRKESPTPSCQLWPVS